MEFDPATAKLEFDPSTAQPDERRVAASESRPTALNAGLASFATGLAGAPGLIAKGLVNIPGMAFGAAATAVGRPDLSPGIINVPGQPEEFEGLLRRTGVAGLSPDNPNPNDKNATAAYELTKRGGFMPGGVLPAVGSMVAEKIGGPQWAGVGALAPSAATAAFNASRAPGLAREQAQNQVRDATLRPAQDAGYVLPQSAIKPTGAGNAVESFAGKSAINQEAQIKNQQVTNRLVREELQMVENAPITEQSLNTLRDQAAAPYRQVASLSPQASKALEVLRDTRSQAKDQWRHWDMQGVPDAKRQAQALDAKANMLETLLERQARSAGKPQLVDELREARTYIAKTYDVERALNLGNGNVDAQIIGRALDRGRPLSGNLEIIAKFAEGPGRKFTREESKVQAPGVSALNWPMAGALGIEGHHLLGPAGVAAAAIPFVRGGVRQGILSDFFQQRFNRPDYAPNMLPQNDLQSVLQQAILANQNK